MQSLKDKVSIRKIKEALAQLPRGSGSAASKIAYDETMNRIRGQEKGFCDLAIATLSWISLAKSRLTLRELQCALSVEPGDTTMGEANFVDEETLSSVCAGLIVVDHESRIVRLAHYTTQEYFDSQKDVLFSHGQKLLATTCLTYLSFDVFSNWQLEKCGPNDWYSKPPGSMAVCGEREIYSHYYPLLSYAASHWHEHAHSSKDPIIQTLIMDYLKRTDKLAALLCCMDSHHDISILPESFSAQSIHGLLIAARYGFTEAVKALRHLEGYCAEDRYKIKSQALSLAAGSLKFSALRILLDGNTIAPAEASCALNFIYTIMPWAQYEFYEVHEIFLNHGANANTLVNDRPLIHFASVSNDLRFADLLLSHGADVNLRDREGRTALHVAAGNICTENIVIWLLENGLDIDARDCEGRTALHCAVEAGHSGDIVKVLLENKLDINARDCEGRTALMTSVRHSEDHDPSEPIDWNLFTQLLGFGASLDQSDLRGWTALHWAAFDGAVRTACQILKAGADVNFRDENGHTAADRLSWWEWDSMPEGERAECEEILEWSGFYQSGDKWSVQDRDYVAYDGDEDLC